MIFLAIVILLSALPIGLLVSWLARDELRMGKQWFMRVSVFGTVVGAVCFAYGLVSEGLSAWYLAIIGFVSYCKA